MFFKRFLCFIRSTMLKLFEIFQDQIPGKFIFENKLKKSQVVVHLPVLFSRPFLSLRISWSRVIEFSFKSISITRNNSSCLRLHSILSHVLSREIFPFLYKNIEISTSFLEIALLKKKSKFLLFCLL